MEMSWQKLKNNYLKLTKKGRVKLVHFFQENVAENVMAALNYLKSYDIDAQMVYLKEAARCCENANMALGALPIYDSGKNKYAYMLLREIGIGEFKSVIAKFEQGISMLEKRIPNNYEHKDTIEFMSVYVHMYHRIMSEYENF